MLRVLLGIMLAVTTYLVFAYVRSYQPELISDFILRMDVYGITSVAKQEQERREKIRALDIPYEQKQVLYNKTVFLGASAEMVEFALGVPKFRKQCRRTLHDQGTPLLPCYVYYLPNSRRPTVFVFEGDSLAGAYKDSALDVGN